MTKRQKKNQSNLIPVQATPSHKRARRHLRLLVGLKPMFWSDSTTYRSIITKQITLLDYQNHVEEQYNNLAMSQIKILIST